MELKTGPVTLLVALTAHIYAASAAEWAGWMAWSPCTHDCGGGSQSRARFCNSPLNDCPGENLDLRDCNTQACKNKIDPCERNYCSDYCTVYDGEAYCTCKGMMAIGEDEENCYCPDGYVRGAEKDSCVVEDACKDGEHECSHTCNTVAGEAVCSCPANLNIGTDGATCECPEGMVPGVGPDTCKQAPKMPEDDPCKIDNGGCGVHTCIADESGTHSCQCNGGYTSNPDRNPPCQDIDECMISAADGGADCEHDCQNTEGSFTCGCPAGEQLETDGRTCVPDDVDICDECVNSVGCEQVAGRTTCICGPGHQLAVDDRTCIDINECDVDNGGCLLDCYNTQGTHTCQCEISCKPGYVQEGNKCVGACSVGNGGCSHICDVNDGEVECSCPNAGLLNPVDEKTCRDPCTDGRGGGCEEICESSELFHVTCKCEDGKPASDDGGCRANRFGCQPKEKEVDGDCIEKCNIDNGGCHESEECSYDAEGITQCNCPVDMVKINDGSCKIECSEGYDMDMDTGDCQDINECDLETDECEQECVNTAGSFRCECTDGVLDINGKTCTTTDPCEENDGGCEHECVYVAHEKYKCECYPGFVLNTDLHNCDSVCDINNGECRENSQCELTDNGEVRCPCETGLVEEDEQCVHPCDLDVTPCDDMVCERADTGDDAVPYICMCSLGEVMNLETDKCEDGCKTYGCDRNCINLMDGTYECECDDTEVLNGDGKTCDDKDECAENNGECIMGRCVNDVPGHHCECDAPLELDVDERTCVDYDVCLKDKPCDYKCEDLEGRAYVCTCPPGSELASDKTTCLEKCKVKNGGCEHTCNIDDDGDVVCECRDGYRLGTGGKSCDDINECEEYTHECDMTCENTEGSYMCSCPEGTELHTDGKQCLTIDPCEVNKGGCSDYCSHEDGRAVCTCSAHMELLDDKQTCRHVCDRENNNGCDQVCDRKSGGCTCNQGWELASDGKTCEDINECEEVNDCERVCNNVQGSYECSCGPGFTISNVSPSKCDDIDECLVNNGGCRQLCANEPGSYRCKCDDINFLCLDGYTHDPATDKCHADG